MEKKDEIITILMEIKKTIDDCDKHALHSKTDIVKSILDRFYEPEHAYQIKLKYIRKRLQIIKGSKSDDIPFGPNLPKIKELFHQLIDLIITEANHLGFPDKSDIHGQIN